MRLATWLASVASVDLLPAPVAQPARITIENHSVRAPHPVGLSRVSTLLECSSASLGLF